MQSYIPQQTEQRILCASCGTPIAPNAANMCIDCIRSQHDITAGIPKQATLHFCRGCDRYLQPPGSTWIKAELESRELLALCLKRLKGLDKVRLVDAGFVWTEPHSKRVKVKLTIQKEVMASTILQQVFIVEYIVAGQYCEDCTRVDAQLTWKAVVQVRQKVTHKRTFLWLEQLILKHNAHRDTTNIKEFRDGLDFYYSSRSHAIKMVDFLTAVVPLRVKTSEQLISSDVHSGTADFKYTFSVEVVPVCKDDLLCLPSNVMKRLGGGHGGGGVRSPLVLCTRVSNSLTLVDPLSGTHLDLRPNMYWETPFSSLCEMQDLCEFYVIDIQQEGRAGKYMMATAEIAPARDISRSMFIRTHLRHILNPGDHVKGYMLASANFNNDSWDALMSGRSGSRAADSVPDVILVRKSYPNARKRLARSRNWKLKSMVKEEDLEAYKTKANRAKAELDYELFLRDVEEDRELRGMINLYKAPESGSVSQGPHHGDAETGGDVSMGGAAANDTDDDMVDDDDENPEEDFPEIDVTELLDDMENMRIDDGADE